MLQSAQMLKPNSLQTVLALIFQHPHPVCPRCLGTAASSVSWKNSLFGQISSSGTLSDDLDSIWACVLVWEGGSMVKRITQNSPMRCSLSSRQLFSSIHPCILPSFVPSSLLCPSPSVFSSLSVLLFPPLSRRLYCPSVTHFPYHPPSLSSTTMHPLSTNNLFSFSFIFLKSFSTSPHPSTKKVWMD